MPLVIRILSRLPLSLLYIIADVVIYPLAYYVLGYRKKVVRKNLRHSFPEKSKSELRTIERQFYHHFASMLAEVVYGYRASQEEMRQRVVFENIDMLLDLAHDKRGVIIGLGHICNWEWIADLGNRLAEKSIVEYNVYRQLKNPRSNRMMLDLRSKRGGECVEKNLILRQLVSLRRAADSYVVGMVADQKPSKRSSYVWTQFLHQETAFLDGSEVLARKFNLPFVYAHILSPERGYYRVRFELISDHPEALAPGDMTRKYAALLEQNILLQPHQWLWTHNRWKWNRAYLEA